MLDNGSNGGSKSLAKMIAHSIDVFTLPVGVKRENVA